MALFLRWCVERGLVSEDHTEDEDFARDLARARRASSGQSLSFDEREVEFEVVRALLDKKFADHKSRPREPKKPWWRFW
jgi:hypothetical protein